MRSNRFTNSLHFNDLSIRCVATIECSASDMNQSFPIVLPVMPQPLTPQFSNYVVSVEMVWGSDRFPATLGVYIFTAPQKKLPDLVFVLCAMPWIELSCACTLTVQGPYHGS